MVPKTQRVATKEHGRWCKTVSDSVLQMLRQIGVGGVLGGNWVVGGGGRGGLLEGGEWTWQARAAAELDCS